MHIFSSHKIEIDTTKSSKQFYKKLPHILHLSLSKMTIEMMQVDLQIKKGKDQEPM